MSSPAQRRRPYAARVPMPERREQLLDAALAVIVRDGYDGVSIDAIAREAGVTRPVVYGAYDGLGPLLFALLDREQVRAFSGVLGALPEGADFSEPLSVVAGGVHSLVAMIRAAPDTWRVILLPSSGLPAPVRERIEQDRSRVLGVFAGLIDQVAAANPGPPLDSEVLAHAVLAICEHFGRLLLEEPDRFETERLVASVTTVLGAFFPVR